MVDEHILERDLEKHFTKECKRLNLMTLKLRIMGRRGWPDRLVVSAGKAFLSELKTLTGSLSPLQKRIFPQLQARGMNVQVLRTKSEITTYLEVIADGTP